MLSVSCSTYSPVGDLLEQRVSRARRPAGRYVPLRVRLLFPSQCMADHPYRRREEFAYYMTLDVQEPYISLENFTRFEDVPASQWGKNENSVNLVDEEEYAFTEYGLW